MKHFLAIIWTLMTFTLSLAGSTCDEKDVTIPLKLKDWVKAISFHGDLRLRYEYFNNADNALPQRARPRIRARLATLVEMTDWTKLEFRIASGALERDYNLQGDPISNNQTLTEKFSSKAFNLDRAYFTISPPHSSWWWFYGGKMKTFAYEPRVNSPLLYDHDLSPEGILFRYDVHLRNKTYLYGVMGLLFIEEVLFSRNNRNMLDFQIGLKRLGKYCSSHFTIGYYRTDHTNLMRIVGGLGNSVSATNRNDYFADFQVLSLLAEFEYNFCDRYFLRTPQVINLALEWVTNLNNQYHNREKLRVNNGPHAKGQTNGYSAQIRYGKAKKPCTWEVALQYKYLEADAVWDQLPDSDWGNGGTDRKGWVVYGRYMVRPWWFFGLKSYWTTKISDNISRNSVVGEPGEWLNRVQIDTVVLF